MILDRRLEVSVVEKARYAESKIPFSELIKKVCTISNAHELSYFLHHLIPFINAGAKDINVFFERIKPMWEDKENIDGGKYIIRLRREAGQRIFERTIVSMLATDFTSVSINGIVLSIRPKYQILGIWVKNVPTKEEESIFISELRKSMGVDFDVKIAFKLNNESIKDNSSFRNAEIHN